MGQAVGRLQDVSNRLAGSRVCRIRRRQLKRLHLRYPPSADAYGEGPGGLCFGLMLSVASLSRQPTFATQENPGRR